MDRAKKLSHIIENFLLLRHSMMSQQDSKKDTIPFGRKSALFIIAMRESINVKQLACALHVTSGAATQHIEALSQEGFVVRSQDKDDRRNVIITLTPKGREVSDKLQTDRLERLRILFCDVTDDELEIYDAIMDKIAAKIKPIERDKHG